MPAEALILLAKAPVPGKAKTRLSPPLSRREAAAFYACLLEDTAGEMARLGNVELILSFTPSRDEAYFRSGAFAAFRRTVQRGRDLGERMACAMDEAFGAGARRVVLVGADCPSLAASRVREAFRELRDGASAVFGPAVDGGFYLAGLSAPSPSIFRDVEWGAGRVLSRVTRNCRDAGMAYALLPPDSDVDTAGDIAALERRLRACPSPRCPRTRRWLTSSRGERSACGSSPGRRPRSGP